MHGQSNTNINWNANLNKIKKNTHKNHVLNESGEIPQIWRNWFLPKVEISLKIANPPKIYLDH